MMIPRYNITDFKHKRLMINNLSDIIESNVDTHYPFFLTVTFKGMMHKRSYDAYRAYFQRMRQRFDKQLLSNSRDDKRRPILIMCPEQHPALHFHGIFLLHKKTSERFNKNCYVSQEEEFSDKLNRNITAITISDQLIDPYPREAFRELIVDTYKLYPLRSRKDRLRATSYSTKHFVMSEFNDTDLIIEMKPPRRSSDHAQYK